MKVLSVAVGRPKDVEWRGEAVNTAINKTPVHGPVAVRRLNLEGDQQADLTVHGGPNKAVYAYPSEHYRFWQTVRSQARVSPWDDALPPGSLGENLTLVGLLESQVWVGDVLRFPDADLAVSEPRFPCFKFNAAMGFAQAAALMQANAWCGFYLTVLRPGTLQCGQAFELIAGPREVGITELFRARSGRPRR
jgi:MOSC domain-containing protein YiiM